MERNPFQYDMPFRPNYEGQALLGWVLMLLFLGAVITLKNLPGASIPVLSVLPIEPFYWMVVIALVMGSLHIPKALRLFRFHQRTRGIPLSFYKPSKLLEIMRQDAPQQKQKRIIDGEKHIDRFYDYKTLWLGYGFEWTRKHAQLVHEVYKRDALETLPHAKGIDEIGDPFIHGLGDKETLIRVPLKHTETHLLIVGTTGSGKTRMFDTLVTQAVMRGEAVILLDPKGDKDLCESARRACRLAGKPEKFLYFNPAFENDSIRIDPLKNYTRPSELATRIAALIPSETGADPFTAFSQMALDIIIQGMKLAKESPSLVTLRRYIASGIDRLVIKGVEEHCRQMQVPQWEKEANPYLNNRQTMEQKAEGYREFYFEQLQRDYPSTTLDAMLGLHKHPSEHFSKMVASLNPILSMLTSGTIGPLLSPTEDFRDRRGLDADRMQPAMDVSRIINGSYVLYMGLDTLSDPMVGSSIGAIFLAELASVAGARYNYGIGDKPVNIFVDEASETANDQLIQILNKARGARMRVAAATQTLSDFTARLGSKEKMLQMLGNINSLIVLRTTDPETQELIVSQLPTTRLQSIDRKHGTNTGSNPIEHGGSIMEGLGEEEGEMFQPAMLGKLPNLEYMAIVSGGRIWKGRIPILTEEQ